MVVRYFYLFLLFAGELITIIAAGQPAIEKTVIDSQTGLPVTGAHVYIDNQNKTGTVTNADGKFILKKWSLQNNLIISHINYQYYVKPVKKLTIDTIRLIKNQLTLNEVVIEGRSAESIMRRLIDSLPGNHFVEPVMYSAYVRVLKYERFVPDVHVVSEYLINLYNREKKATEYYIQKARAKALSPVGEKYIKDMRVISAIGILSHSTVLWDKNEVFNSKNLQDYYFEYAEHTGDTSELSLNCIPRDTQKGRMVNIVLDKDSYAIKKLTKYYTDDKEEYIEIGFKKVNSKWYLDYSRSYTYTSFFEIWQSGSEAVVDVLAVYDIDKTAGYDKATYQKFVFIVAEPIRYHLTDWQDSFWENYHYVPLPRWVKQKIVKNK